MKLSFQSGAYLRYSAAETVHHLARLGYQGVEFSRAHPVHELSRQDRVELRELVRREGIEVAGVQASTPYLDVEFARARIDAAADLESRIVSLGPIGDVKDERERESIWKEAVQNIKEVAQYARSKGITVAVEPEPPVVLPAGRLGRIYPRIVSTLADAQRILADVPNENFGILLDVGHMYVVGENVIHVIERLGNKIVHVHIEDIVDRLHCHFIPGRGMVDFEGVLLALGKIGYSGFVSVDIESYVNDPDGAALESIEYLDSLQYSLGLK